MHWLYTAPASSSACHRLTLTALALHSTSITETSQTDFSALALHGTSIISTSQTDFQCTGSTQHVTDRLSVHWLYTAPASSPARHRHTVGALALHSTSIISTSQTDTQCTGSTQHQHHQHVTDRLSVHWLYTAPASSARHRLTLSALALHSTSIISTSQTDTQCTGSTQHQHHQHVTDRLSVHWLYTAPASSARHRL